MLYGNVAVGQTHVPLNVFAIAYIAAPLLLGPLATTVSRRTNVLYLALIVLAHLWFERRLAPNTPLASNPTDQ